MDKQIGCSGTNLHCSMPNTGNACPRDLGGHLSMIKAALVLVQVGHGAWGVNAKLNYIIQSAIYFGEVMVLKRNSSGINEEFGTYDHYPAFLKLMLFLTELAAKEVV